MGAKTKWKNVEKVVSLEFLVNIDWSGYYDPGRISGPPEKCYPPEGDEERLIDSIEVIVGDKGFFLERGSPAFKALMELVMPRSETTLEELLQSFVDKQDWEMPGSE